MRPAEHTELMIDMLGVGEHCFIPSICACDVMSIHRSSTLVMNSVPALTAVYIQQQLRLTSWCHVRLMEL